MSQNQGHQFGTFKGVFTPTILTILGVVMFLRSGWMLGNVGLPLTILIVTLASSITLMTGLAIAALATNMEVGKGGAYYIISRSLGLEMGAAIGVPLFLAQALGVAFYVIGLSESIVGVWPSLDPKVVGTVALVLVTSLAMLSASLALRMQYIILAMIILALASFFLGAPPEPRSDLPDVSQISFAPFWVVFAVFFPAVTGIEAGISMSGDLKNPGKSLAVGTLGAIVVGYLVYLAIPIFLTQTVQDRALLVEEPLVMWEVARWGNAILIGLWGAAVSSAMGAVLGAPRTMQALASDRVLPTWLAKGFGPALEPRIATAVTFGIALGAVLLGDLDAIAPLLTMFFLASYGLLNTAAALEAKIASPGWRPRLKLPWFVHLLGALACFAVMVLINLWATIAALTLASSVFVIMKRRNLRKHWGDVGYGVAMMLVRSGLLRLQRSEPDPHTWKPNILVLSGTPTSRWYLLELAYALTECRSLMTVATVLAGENVRDERVGDVSDSLERHFRKEGMDPFVRVLKAESLNQGRQSLVEAYGFGPVIPNTVMLGTCQDPERVDSFIELCERVHQVERNLVLVKPSNTVALPERVHRSKREQLVEQWSSVLDSETKARPRIDVWWSGSRQNVGLMLALTFQLRQSATWKDHELALKTVVDGSTEDMEPESTPSHGESKLMEHMTDFVASKRLGAECGTVVRQDGESVIETIHRNSEGADLVILGLPHPQTTEESERESFREVYQRTIKDAEGMPTTMFVMAQNDYGFMKIFE